MFGGKRKQLVEQAANDLVEAFDDLLKKYNLLALDYYESHFRELDLPHLPDAAASERRMRSLSAALAIRAALDEIGASPKSFTYGDARDYATSELVEALRERFLLSVGRVLPQADMSQVNGFLADARYSRVTRWVLLGNA